MILWLIGSPVAIAGIGSVRIVNTRSPEVTRIGGALILALLSPRIVVHFARGQRQFGLVFELGTTADFFHHTAVAPAVVVLDAPGIAHPRHHLTRTVRARKGLRQGAVALAGTIFRRGVRVAVLAT